MAFGFLSPRSLTYCFFFFLLLDVAVIDSTNDEEVRSLREKFYNFMDHCRGGKANHRCCKAINDAISSENCQYTCHHLKIIGHRNLTTKCSSDTTNWCPLCQPCNCTINSVP